MRKVIKYLLLVIVAAGFAVMSSGCLRQDMLIFEDGEFDGMEFSDYDLMHNAEVEMDDVDRNWRPLAIRQHVMPRPVAVKWLNGDLKNINRAGVYVQ